MGPPGMPSLGGMLPITGLGAAAALWKKKNKTNDKVWHQKLHFTSATSSNRTISNKTEGYDRAQRILHSLNFRDSLMATQLFSHTDKSFVQSHKTFFCHNAVVWGETLNLQGAFSRSGE